MARAWALAPPTIRAGLVRARAPFSGIGMRTSSRSASNPMPRISRLDSAR